MTIKKRNRFVLVQLKVALRALGFDPTAADIRQLVLEHDPDNKGLIDFKGFLEIMTLKMTEKSEKADLIKAFRICDDDDSGKLTLSKLKRAAQLLGEDINDEELQVRLIHERFQYPISFLRASINQ
ncbi:unnamed protein product, partial [Trichobilharzia regenti]